MYLLSDFQAALVAAVQSRAATAEAYRAGDPDLIANVNALATMLTMLSQQIDVAEVEPFLKARAGTVLADASLRGILPLATPAMARLAVRNPTAQSVTLSAGRGLFDSRGRHYIVEADGTIAAGLTALITAKQITRRQQVHTVSGSSPFYSIAVDPSGSDRHLAGINVLDAVNAFAFKPEFCNVDPGAKVFHAETNEYRQLVLRFGADGIVGYQPANGDVLTIVVTECNGRIDLDAGSPFALESTVNAYDAALVITLSELLSAGSDPPDIDTLRVLARYPALHDSNAVFLSNFDFLLRWKIPGLEFLSVWNEQVEEAVRGANVANINRLFVSVSSTTLLTAATQDLVRQVVAKADDSYRVNFVAKVDVPVPVTVVATIAAVHDAVDVATQIKNALLALYGRGTVAAAKGMSRIRMQAVHDELRANVAALQDQLSDFTVSIGATPTPLPEHFRYMDAAHIVVTVTQVQDSIGLWAL